jgi:hypothetical protein
MENACGCTDKEDNKERNVPKDAEWFGFHHNSPFNNHFLSNPTEQTYGQQKQGPLYYRWQLCPSESFINSVLLLI